METLETTVRIILIACIVILSFRAFVGMRINTWYKAVLGLTVVCILGLAVYELFLKGLIQ